MDPIFPVGLNHGKEVPWRDENTSLERKFAISR